MSKHETGTCIKCLRTRPLFVLIEYAEGGCDLCSIEMQREENRLKGKRDINLNDMKAFVRRQLSKADDPFITNLSEWTQYKLDMVAKALNTDLTGVKRLDQIDWPEPPSEQG